MNRLAGAASPYLRQHADNPVPWWPWCDAAWQEAQRRDVPVLVSIGYATCHWCHVMAHECFEDPEVGAAIGEQFVAIKVDREERPDVDAAYMAYCQATRGNGGWPLNVWCAPDKTPFFAATYVPRRGRGQHPGILELMERIRHAWDERRDDLMAGARHVQEHLGTGNRSRGPGHGAGHDGGHAQDAESFITLDADQVKRWRRQAHATLEARLDRQRGGIGGAPKFPMATTLAFLLEGDAAAREGALTTARAMQRGGIHDHVGGGFHRYSTDPDWLVPHFEKMLYDQALLVSFYVDCYAATGDGAFARTLERTIHGVQRDFTRADGLLASGEDADAEGEEGRFTTWLWSELEDILGPKTRAFADAYGAKQAGNFADEATGQASPRNILHWCAPGEPDPKLDDALGRLLEVRQQRERPLRDDKALADWNWLWVRALARHGRLSNHEPATAAAGDLANRLLAQFGATRVAHCHLEETTGAFLPDQAYAAWALLDLFEATSEAKWFATALTVAEGLEDYRDGDGYRLAASAEPGLPNVPPDWHDGALPSPVGVAAFVQARLWHLTHEPRWEKRARTSLSGVAAQVDANPAAAPMLIRAATELLDGEQIVLVEAEHLQAAATSSPNPHRVVLTASATLREALPWLDAYREPGAYVCRKQTCFPPVLDAGALKSMLDT